MNFHSKKFQDLDRRIALLGRVAVAFSGGVDSTALLHACVRILGKHRVLAVTADSESLPRHELHEAVELAGKIGVRLLLVRTFEMANPDYVKNDRHRCYYCKKELFQTMERIAGERRLDSLVYGAIADDLLDFRPGAKAAREFRVAAPFQEAGLSKEEIRRYSRSFGLPTASKASFACLASRIPRGRQVRPEILKKIEAGEAVLRHLGFRQYRVRHHEDCARVELDLLELPRALGPEKDAIVEGLLKVGYLKIEFDLRGYRSPSDAAAKPQENFSA